VAVDPERYRRAEPYPYAFDCLWLDGRDLRGALWWSARHPAGPGTAPVVPVAVRGPLGRMSRALREQEMTRRHPELGLGIFDFLWLRV